MANGFASPKDSANPRPRQQPLPPALDAETVQVQWQAQFAELDDPRGSQGIEHPFLSIVMIAILAVIGGATGWEDIETYAESHEAWLSTLLSLPNGVPHADTYRRLFERMAPDALERCFLGWVKQIVEGSGAQVIPIDGKTVKGSYDRNAKQSALHVVSAWASEHRLLLGQVKVASKSNEITAIPALLNLLDISGCIITLDAMGTQKEIAREIIGHGADYVLCLKANHPTLWAEVTAWFERAEATDFAGLEHSYDTRVESGHHRREHRHVWAVPVAVMGELHQIEQWAGLKTMVMVRRVRHLWNQITRETMIYLTSLPGDAALIGRAIRTHWGIENQLHWVLDVTWGEDKSRIRRGHGGENMALLRRLAISVLNQETSKKRSLKQKAKRASMSPDYMLTVLAAGLAP
ncbi:MAG: ISAs1 family transposase [Synechococcaceae cyanobacterium SM2_3_60]|nr:ISAs1 family transposase [Synechococcaceae cyanobacterium SM2_3_60]